MTCSMHHLQLPGEYQDLLACIIIKSTNTKSKSCQRKASHQVLTIFKVRYLSLYYGLDDVNYSIKIILFNFLYSAPNFIYSEIYRCEVGSYFTKVSRIVKTFANKTDCGLSSKSSSGYKIYDVMKKNDLGLIKIHVNYTVMAFQG